MSDHMARQAVRNALLGLPDKERNKNLTGRLARFSGIAEQSRDSFRSALKLSDLVTLVFPDASFLILGDRVQKATSNARSCHKEMAKGMDAVAKQTFEDRMIAIKDSASAASKPVAETWRDKLAAEVRAYEQVGKIAADRGLPGGPGLAKTLQELVNRSLIPPQSENDAEAISVKLKGLPAEVKALGLIGKAGDFLVAAADGRGSPRDLEESEVRDLLDRYELWDSLLVTLGPRK